MAEQSYFDAIFNSAARSLFERQPPWPEIPQGPNGSHSDVGNDWNENPENTEERPKAHKPRPDPDKNKGAVEEGG